MFYIQNNVIEEMRINKKANNPTNVKAEVLTFEQTTLAGREKGNWKTDEGKYTVELQHNLVIPMTQNAGRAQHGP